MGSISPTAVFMVLASTAAQLIGLTLIPMTRGLSSPVPTIGAAAAFLLGIGIMARMAHAGMNLSLLVPIMAVTVPLGAIAIGVLFYGETASFAKIATLAVACGLIGLSNLL